MDERQMISTIKLTRMNTVYLVRGETGCILVDTPANKKLLPKLLEALKSLDTKPEDIDYILITHNHTDHCATIADIQKMHYIPLICHKYTKEVFESGSINDPKAEALYSVSRINALFISFMSRIFKSQEYDKPMLRNERDIIIDSENNTVLRSLGIAARVLPTPGHSVDSISVVFDNGEAIIGDLVTGMFTYPVPFIFNSLADFRESIEKLNAANVKTVHYTHSGTARLSEITDAVNKPLRTYQIKY